MAFVIHLLTPIVVAIVATVLARGVVRDRWVFFLIALILAIGAQTLVRAVVEYWPLMRGNYFLENPCSRSAEEILAQLEGEFKKSALVSLVAIVVTTPLLRYLATHLSR